MILGTAKFGFDYNGLQVEKKDVFDILDYYYENGGRYIDTALNYRDAQKILTEWRGQNNINDLKISTKIVYQEDYSKCMDELKLDKIYCVLARDSANNDTIEFLKDQKNCGDIEKFGISIYYPKEIRQDVNIVFIENSYKLWENYLSGMILHADIHIRSFFNKNDKNVNRAYLDYSRFKVYGRKDLNHSVNAVIGVSNLEQLQINMGLFK